METLEFIIHPDGRVEERVTGIVGSSCAAVTAAIEAKLGTVAYRELTAEHYATSSDNTSHNISHNTVVEQLSRQTIREFSQW